MKACTRVCRIIGYGNEYVRISGCWLEAVHDRYLEGVRWACRCSEAPQGVQAPSASRHRGAKTHECVEITCMRAPTR